MADAPSEDTKSDDTQSDDTPQVEAYCVKCKAKQQMNEPNQIEMKNGRPAVQGTCPKCGTKMFRIGAIK